MKRELGLGQMRYWRASDDPQGFVWRVKLSSWCDTKHCLGRHQVLAKAIDGALRQAFEVFAEEQETIVQEYRAAIEANNGTVAYEVAITLLDGQKLKAKAGCEGLAVFAALWSYYKKLYPNTPVVIMGNLGKLMEKTG